MACKKGEDRAGSSMIKIGGETVLVLLVADGHGGEEAAEHCLTFVIPYIAEEAMDASASSLQNACDRAFKRVHADVVAKWQGAGTTLTVAMFNYHRRQ